MTGRRQPLFCSIELAGQIERAEAGLIEAASRAAARRNPTGGGFVLPVAGGIASFAEPGSPYNKVAGLGFGGTPTDAELDQIERSYDAVGASVSVELAHLADPETAERLTARGYRLEAFENVLGRRLDDTGARVELDGIEIRRSGDDELDEWLDVAADAVAAPDTQGLAWHEEFPRQTYIDAERDGLAAGVLRYSAVQDGELVGVGGLRMDGEIAQFAGAATAPAFRRRGIQSALLSARLADAAAAGCQVAVIVVQPASKSQQNSQRSGFDLLYTRAVLVR